MNKILGGKMGKNETNIDAMEIPNNNPKTIWFGFHFIVSRFSFYGTTNDEDWLEEGCQIKKNRRTNI